MRPSEVFAQHRETIRQMVYASGMANPRVFGSVLHGDDTDGSDLDILVDPSSNTSLLDLSKLKIQLESAAGLKIDLLTPRFLPASYRDQVLAEAQPL